MVVDDDDGFVVHYNAKMFYSCTFFYDSSEQNTENTSTLESRKSLKTIDLHRKNNDFQGPLPILKNALNLEFVCSLSIKHISKHHQTRCFCVKKSDQTVDGTKKDIKDDKERLIQQCQSMSI